MLLANDSGGLAVIVPDESGCDATGQIRFYQNAAKTLEAATSDANAKFVEVEVDPREAFYALTPVVGAFGQVRLQQLPLPGWISRSGRPPVMLWNPNEFRRSRLHDCQ